MALRFPTTQFPLSSSSYSFTTSSPKLSFQHLKPQLIFTQSTFRTKIRLAIKVADDDGLKPTANENASESQTDNNNNNQQNPQQTTLAGEDPSNIGEEIRKAMNERDIAAVGGGGDLWGGVAEEIKQIEWPAFGKVLGTTGAVIGVIAGSSLVLLTLNAILAELSDGVFAGKGVQDFFS